MDGTYAWPRFLLTYNNSNSNVMSRVVWYYQADVIIYTNWISNTRVHLVRTSHIHISIHSDGPTESATHRSSKFCTSRSTQSSGVVMSPQYALVVPKQTLHVQWCNRHPRMVPKVQDAPMEHCKWRSLNNVTPHLSKYDGFFLVRARQKVFYNLDLETMQHVRIQYPTGEDVLWNNKREN